MHLEFHYADGCLNSTAINKYWKCLYSTLPSDCAFYNRTSYTNTLKNVNSLVKLALTSTFGEDMCFK